MPSFIEFLYTCTRYHSTWQVNANGPDCRNSHIWQHVPKPARISAIPGRSKCPCQVFEVVDRDARPLTERFAPATSKVRDPHPSEGSCCHWMRLPVGGRYLTCNHWKRNLLSAQPMIAEQMQLSRILAAVKPC
jgi:hypothetical protein